MGFHWEWGITGLPLGYPPPRDHPEHWLLYLPHPAGYVTCQRGADQEKKAWMPGYPFPVLKEFDLRTGSKTNADSSSWTVLLISLLALVQRRQRCNFLRSSRIWVHTTLVTSTVPAKSDPNKIKVICLRGTGGEVSAMSTVAPKISTLSLSPKKYGDDIAKAAGNWKGLKIPVKLTMQNRQAQTEIVPSSSASITKALKELPRDRKKQKKKKKKKVRHSRNITFDEIIINIPQQMQHQSLAREFSGTSKEILGTAQAVGCNLDGCHPHDIIDEIKRGAVECPAS
ncbi:LOW QUALITY PROTEIN: 60S ribosomal protein L12-like [Rousettus aegyptiacus]|uniref:LOW QUALITY PROTEIN: 60S ribosomal protein L12-like n=1 Tax=Rousettus aegyptiacus TaxID=9407 RepID=UPI00168D2BC3|nr:LOW QUALITY PROTEIN: 60S ribosomal protein L12-like [Rousettus aegyptiacus]